MNFNRTQTVIVSDGTAFPTAGGNANSTNILAGDMALIDVASTVMTPGKTVSDSGIFRIVQGTSTGLKWSMEIPGRSISGCTGRSYAPLQRKTVAIGYNRATSAGSITVTNDTEYEFSIVNKSDKQTFSQRLGKSTVTIKSALSATQLLIAAQICNAINNSPYFSKFVTAILVGDGTLSSVVAASGTTPAIYGGTAASNYGVEITSKLLTQATGSYIQEVVNFDVECNQDSGFGAGFRPTTINSMVNGTGTYQRVYNQENFAFSVEGTINRTMFPINLPTASAVSTGQLSAAITTSGNVGVTASVDIVTFSTANIDFVAGDILDIAGVAAEIKYLISTTSAVIMTPWSSTTGNKTTKKRMFYDIVSIAFSDPKTSTGNGMSFNNDQSVYIAVPSIDATNAYTTLSSAGNDLLAVLNPYLNSVGLASVSI